MTVEIISRSIFTEVWDRTGIKLPTPVSAVKLASVARHITDSATRPGATVYWIIHRTEGVIVLTVEVEGNSVSGHPQHRWGDSLTACCTERYEIVVCSDQVQSGYKLFDTLMVFLKDFFKKVNFEKKSAGQKNMPSFPACKRVEL